jgi:TolB-like protein
MAAIFLSYSREDHAFAETLSDLLEQSGHDVWWDRDIDSGSEFSGEIEAALERADVVLVAWSRSSAKSAWVRDEAAIGRDSGRLIPVVIDGSQPPMGFRQFQALDLTGWKGRSKDPRTAALLGSIDRRASSSNSTRARTAPVVSKAQSERTARRSPRSLWIVAAALVLLVGAAGTALFFFNGRKPETAGKPTIALMPFTAASSDPQLRDLATRTRDALSNSLSQSGVPVRLLDAVPTDKAKAGDFLIFGEISRNADKIIATIRLNEAAHDVTVSSSRFEAGPSEVVDFPDRIAAHMAASLSNGATLLALDRRHPVDPAILAELLAESADQLQRYQVAKRVAAKAPDVPSAQIGVAFFTGFVLDQLPRDERPRAVAEARQAAERAHQLAPEFGDTYGTWCFLHSDTRFAECENQLRTGMRIDPDAPYLRGFLAALLRGVGRLDEASEATRLYYAHDPYDVFKISDMLRTYEAEGDSEDARQLYGNAVRWYPELKPNFFRTRIFGLAMRGDFESMVRVEQEVGKDLSPDYTRSTAIASAVKSKSAPAVRAACAGAEPDAFVLIVRCMVAFAVVGDLDSAYAIADKIYPRRVGRTPTETEKIWLDDPAGAGPLDFVTSSATAPMRGDPRYLQLVRRVGLLSYWRSGRAPDFCQKKPEPICRQLVGRE